MYLKSLEMQGFKSFPDKTQLNFNKGITAVVGPNGSGKSNIADAMRWVMGEQSSKTLRGEKMTGVIFHGCSTRKQSPFSQVTITIDNEDGGLNYDSDVVSVSRKLYRNGDSEYMINGSQVKLKEVNELFMDTGLGKDGYSIVGQGKIADIVNGKSNRRREIFEEAAGIAKLRYKKEEAQKKLAAAKENISRLNDIISELEGRITPLKKQCEKAKLFRKLDEQKSSLEISLWLNRLEEYRTSLEEYEQRIQLLAQQRSALSQELAHADKIIEENLQLSAQRSEQVDRLKEQIHLTELENRSAASQIAVCENDISHLNERVSQIRESIKQSSEDKSSLEDERKKRMDFLRQLSDKREETSRKIADKESEFESLAERAQQSDKSVGELNSAIAAAYLKKSRLSFLIEGLKNTISETQEQICAAKNSLEELKQSGEELSKQTKALCTQKQECSERVLETKNRLDGLNRLFEKRSEGLAKISDEFSKTDMTIREISGRLQLLHDLESSMEGFGSSVKHIMKAARQGRISGVCGSVAQLITVKPEYSVAIEIALGAAMQNIVVENEDAAKRGIRLLKENSAGRATFLPLTSVRGIRLDNPHLENEDGYVAVGCDLAECESRFKGVISYLLGRICIAEDIDSASRIAKKYGYRFRIVTLDGQVINAGGSFTGGSVSKSTGILTRKNEISRLDERLNKLKQTAEELSVKKQRLTSEVNKFSADIEGLKQTLSQLSEQSLKLEMQIQRAEENAKQSDEKMQEEADLCVQLELKLEQANSQLDENAAELTQTDKEIFDGEVRLSDSQNEQTDLKQCRQKISEQLSQMRITAAEINKDIESARASVQQLTDSIESSECDNDKAKLDIIRLQKDINDNREKIEKIKQSAEDSRSLVDSLNEQIKIAQREHLEFDKIAAKERSAQKNKLDERETLVTQLTRAEEKRNSLTADFDRLAAQLWDEYELTRTTAAESAQRIDDIAAANKQLTQLKNQIRSLGSVNLSAIEEYAQVSERYEFMSKQLNDVNVSRAELCEMIDTLTEKMKSLFMHSFECINVNFKQIFTELFGGGKGELILTDTQDVLECDIEINVQPPGKVITNLISLSGGEQSLAAIAIYFAILKNSPSPFCLLDEIEAALDDVNVTRYAQYLHRLTDKTQFITITHRRGTMEEADVLYGVTMQEKGISKLLKMSVEQTRLSDLEE